MNWDSNIVVSFTDFYFCFSRCYIDPQPVVDVEGTHVWSSLGNFSFYACKGVNEVEEIIARVKETGNAGQRSARVEELSTQPPRTHKDAPSPNFNPPCMIF